MEIYNIGFIGYGGFGRFLHNHRSNTESDPPFVDINRSVLSSRRSRVRVPSIPLRKLSQGDIIVSGGAKNGVIEITGREFNQISIIILTCL